MSKEKSTYLVEDRIPDKNSQGVWERERRRREAEQDYLRRRFAVRVHSREHTQSELSQGLEEALDNGMLPHPYLDGQHFDGIDPSVNSDPALNSTSRAEFDNAKREKQKEHQNRLENQLNHTHTPGFNPKPRGP